MPNVSRVILSSSSVGSLQKGTDFAPYARRYGKLKMLDEGLDSVVFIYHYGATPKILKVYKPLQSKVGGNEAQRIVRAYHADTMQAKKVIAGNPNPRDLQVEVYSDDDNVVKLPIKYEVISFDNLEGQVGKYPHLIQTYASGKHRIIDALHAGMPTILFNNVNGQDGVEAPRASAYAIDNDFGELGANELNALQGIVMSPNSENAKAYVDFQRGKVLVKISDIGANLDLHYSRDKA